MGGSKFYNLVRHLFNKKKKLTASKEGWSEHQKGQYYVIDHLLCVAKEMKSFHSIVVLWFDINKKCPTNNPVMGINDFTDTPLKVNYSNKNKKFFIFETGEEIGIKYWAYYPYKENAEEV